MIRNADSLIYTEVRPIWQEFRLTDDNLPAEINTIATTAPGRMALWYRLIIILPILFMKSTGSNLQPISYYCVALARCERRKRESSVVDCYGILRYQVSLTSLFSANSFLRTPSNSSEKTFLHSTEPVSSSWALLVRPQLPDSLGGWAVGSLNIKFIIMASASVIENTRWKRRSSEDGFVSHQGAAGSSSVPRLSKKRIKWYQKAILSGLVALVFISNGGLTSVSLDTFFASSYHTQSFFWIQGSK